MTPGVPIEKGRKMVVNLLASSNNEAAILLAVQLAGHFELDLSVVFTEEDWLYDLAGFSFAKAQQVNAPLSNKITPGEMASAVRRQADLCRQILLEAAEQSDLKWSFSVQRGTLLASLKNAQKYDYVVLPRAPLRGEPDSMLANLRAAENFSKIVLIAAAGSSLPCSRPVLLLVDRVELDVSLVKVAEKLAASTGVSLQILLVGSDDEEAVLGKLQSILHKDRYIEFLQIPAGNADLLISMIATSQASLIVANLSGNTFKDDAVTRQLLSNVKSPFLLMQNEDPD